MNRRLFLKQSGLTAAALMFTGCAKSVQANETRPKQKPNILWITLEDTSFFFGFCGDKVAKTPNIDRLAREGTYFPNTFASSPVCSPARSALITGMYVGQLGAGNHRSAVKIPDYVKGYPAYLKEAGYYCTNHTKTDYNFEGSRQWANALWDDTSKTASWRNRAPGQPFFSIYNFNDSHQSRTSVNSYARFKKNIQSQLSPEEITDPSDVALPPFYHDSPRMRKAYARMYDCITLVDKQVGQRLRQLDEDGLAEDTIVFFYPDHGQGMPRFKTTPLGLGFRVPMIVRVPEKYRSLVDLKPGTTSDAIVSFVDLGPTVMNIAGVKIPDYMGGVPVLGPGKVEKKFFFGSANNYDEAECHSRSVCDGRYLYTRNYMPHLGYTQPQRYTDGAEILTYIRQDYKAGLLTGPEAEFMAPTRPPEVLYDLKKDPWEVNNLVNDKKYARRLEQMRNLTQQKILEIRDLHFLPPWELETRGDGKTPCEFRDDPAVYPLKKILATAELAGKGPSVLDSQLAALKDDEPVVRYWAVIGLYSQDWHSKKVQDALTAMLNDPAPYVRYEAAYLCYKHSTSPKAKAVLVAGLKEDHSMLVSHAIRKIRLLDNDAADFIKEIEQLKKTYRQLPDKKSIYPITVSIQGIELHLAGEYAKPVDSF